MAYYFSSNMNHDVRYYGYPGDLSVSWKQESASNFDVLAQPRSIAHIGRRWFILAGDNLVTTYDTGNIEHYRRLMANP